MIRTVQDTLTEAGHEHSYVQLQFINNKLDFVPFKWTSWDLILKKVDRDFKIMFELCHESHILSL